MWRSCMLVQIIVALRCLLNGPISSVKAQSNQIVPHSDTMDVLTHAHTPTQTHTDTHTHTHTHTHTRTDIQTHTPSHAHTHTHTHTHTQLHTLFCFLLHSCAHKQPYLSGRTVLITPYKPNAMLYIISFS